MTTVNCPKCDEQVRMPDNASAQARVQCPLCADEFELSEALAGLAPMLVVLDDPGRAFAGSLAAGTSFAEADQVGEAESDDASPDFSFESSLTERAATPAFSFEDGSASSGKPGATSARRARSQRPQKSAVKEILKVVGGGVIGLTIGQLILWWLPGNLKKDPFELGPKVPAFAAFLVSPPFRAASVANKDGDARIEKNSPTPASTSFGGFTAGGDAQLPSSSFEGMLDPADIPNDNPQTKNKKKKSNNGGGSKVSVAKADPALDADDPGGAVEPVAGESGNSDPLAPLASEEDIFGGKPEVPVPMVNLNAFPTATDPAPPKEPQPGDSGDSIPPIPPPAVEPATTPPAVPTGDFEGVRNAPTISLDQLSTRLSGAVSASIAMDTSSSEPPAKQKTLTRDFYLTLAELGEAITFVDQASATSQFEEVGKFALEIGKQADKLDLIGKVAPIWMKNNRPHNGLVVCGTVESIEFAAPYYVTSLVLPNDDTLKVVSVNDPSGDYKPQNKVLVLGSILDAPQQNLKNYPGQEKTIILDGLHARLPATE